MGTQGTPAAGHARVASHPAHGTTDSTTPGTDSRCHSRASSPSVRLWRTGMVPVRPATFMVGSPAGEVGRRANEAQTSVTLTRPFWISEAEVTQAHRCGVGTIDEVQERIFSALDAAQA